LLCLCDPPPLDDLLGLCPRVAKPPPFTVKSFLHSLLGLPCQAAQKHSVKNEDVIFAFQERLCLIIEVEIQTDDQISMQVFPTKLNEYLGEKTDEECLQMSDAAITPSRDTQSIPHIGNAMSIPEEDDSDDDGDWVQVSKQAIEDDSFFGSAPARPRSVMSNADGRSKQQTNQDKQNAAFLLANLPKRAKSPLHDRLPDTEATPRSRSDVVEQVTTRKSTITRPPSRAKRAAGSQHGKTKPPIPDAQNQHGRAKSPFSDTEFPTPKPIASNQPKAPIPNIDIPTPKAITASQHGRAKSPFSDTDVPTPKSVMTTQPGRPKPAIPGVEPPTPKSTATSGHDGAKSPAPPAEHITPNVVATSHHSRPKPLISDADLLALKSIPTQQHGKCDTGATTPRSAEQNQRQSQDSDAEFITPKPIAAKARPPGQEAAKLKTPTRSCEADTSAAKCIAFRSKTPTNNDAIASKSSLTKTRPQVSKPPAVEVCERDSATPKSASRAKPKAALDEPTPAAKRRAATPLGAKPSAKKAGATTPVKSESEIGFDLGVNDLELILASVPHERPSMKQQVSAKAKPLATALVAADSSEYSD
jgi:hypothetical protein